MSYGLYVTHPQVVQDPNVPVPSWGLSEVGKAPAWDGHIGVLHHLRMRNVKAVAHQMPPREKWVSSRTIWPTFHLMLPSFGAPASSSTSG